MSVPPKISDLPDVGSDAGSWTRFMNAVREIMQTREGRRGAAPEKGVTFRELVDMGLAAAKPGGGWYGTGGSGDPGPPGPAGPQGPAGNPYVPDLTPPPTPENLRGVSLFKGALIEWDPPVYTLGHGNAYTKIYVAQQAGLSPPFPVFTDAVYSGQVAGSTTIYHHEAAMGARLRFWATFVTADGIESPVPAGGTNGVLITVGFVGNADLGPLIIQAGNIASGAVTPAAFLSGTAPVFFGATLPTLPSATYPVGAIFIRTGDYKLFRSTGTAWTAAADGADIVANTITAGQVGVGGLQAGTIAVGSAAIANAAIRNALIEDLAVTNAKVASVSAAKLTAGSIGVGDYIQSTGFVSGSLGWRITGNGLAEFGAASIRGTITAAQIATGIFSSDNVHTRGLTVRDALGNIVLSAGGLVPIDGYRGTNSQPQQFAAGESFYFKSKVAGFDGPAAATDYGVLRTQRPYGDGADLSGGAVIQWFEASGLVWSRSSASSTTWAAWEAVPNGTITAANASTFIANAAIGNAQIGGDIQSTVFTPGSAGWIIRRSGSAEFDAVHIRGQLTTGQLAAEAATYLPDDVTAVGPFTDTSTIAGITITLTESAKVVVRFSGSMRCSNLTPSTKFLKCNASVYRSGTAYGTAFFARTIASAEEWDSPFVCEASWTLGAGSHTIYGRQANDGSATIDSSAVFVTNHIEVIKR